MVNVATTNFLNKKPLKKKGILYLFTRLMLAWGVLDVHIPKILISKLPWSLIKRLTGQEIPQIPSLAT